MAKIITVDQIESLSKNLKKQRKTIVLAGGCFDILHPGHVVFLKKAKAAGDSLVVFLESDEKVCQLKGVGRPVHPQSGRAQVLSSLSAVDYVVLLPFLRSDAEYDELVIRLKPDIIAATRKEENISHFLRAAKLSGAKLKFVTKVVGNYSTSKILGTKT